MRKKNYVSIWIARELKNVSFLLRISTEYEVLFLFMNHDHSNRILACLFYV